MDNQFQLTDEQKDLLKSKYPFHLPSRIKLLYDLLVRFDFNRSSLSKFLIDNKLHGYSVTQIKRILGPQSITKTEYRTLKRLEKKGLLPQNYLQLIASRNARKKIESAYNESNGHPSHLSHCA